MFEEKNVIIYVEMSYLTRELLRKNHLNKEKQRYLR
tara:strand:+ start:3302 stop:3409 length:108 start_codon:yes stop_codon:yes gene_type:complete